MNQMIGLFFLPWLMLFFPARMLWFRGKFFPGLVATVVALIAIAVVYRHADQHWSGSLFSVFGFEYNLIAEAPRLLFLVMVQLVFLLGYSLLVEKTENIGLIGKILLLSQPLFLLLSLSGNYFVSTVVTLILIAVIFIGLLFSRQKLEPEARAIAQRFFAIYTTASLLLLAWVLTVAGIGGAATHTNIAQLKELSFDQLNTGRGGSAAIFLALAVLLALPMAPWGKWFSRMFELFPESISICVSIFVAAIAFNHVLLAQSVIDEGMIRFRPIFTVMGVVSAFFALGELFSKHSKRSMLSCMPRLLFSILLVGLGMATRSSYRAAYLACLILPLFSALALYFTSFQLKSGLHRILHFVFLFFMIGLPATPMFSTFGLLGEPALAAGINYGLAFGLLWFLYFFANIYILRQLYLTDAQQVESTSLVNANGEQSLVAVLALLLLAFAGVLPWLVRNLV